MKLSDWKFAFVSVVGTSHSRQELPCQDSSICKVLQRLGHNSILAAVVSDGAGSAINSAVSSQLACELFIAEIQAILDTDGDVVDVTQELVQKWLISFQDEIKRRAECEGLTPRDYACTLLAAVVGDKYSVFVQIGDGAIVISSEAQDEHDCVFWPQRGEYENMTNFATDPASVDLVLYKLNDWPIDQVALFSDGLQRLALHFETRTAYAPFFRPMFVPLQNESGGHLPGLSDSLGMFLNSQAVNSRTDDDKTLILASRRPSDENPTSEPVSDVIL